MENKDPGNARSGTSCLEEVSISFLPVTPALPSPSWLDKRGNS